MNILRRRTKGDYSTAKLSINTLYWLIRIKTMRKKETSNLEYTLRENSLENMVIVISLVTQKLTCKFPSRIIKSFLIVSENSSWIH